MDYKDQEYTINAHMVSITLTINVMNFLAEHLAVAMAMATHQEHFINREKGLVSS